MITQEQFFDFKSDVEQLRSDVNRRFDHVDKRFDQVDKRLDRLQGWMIGTGLTIIITILATVGTFSTMVMFSINSVS